MQGSCNNPCYPQYANYGGQGITCAWGKRQYKEFYSWLVNTLGHRPGPSNEWVLGRVDKSGNWEPKNIEWQTIKVRSRTKIRQNVYATYQRKRQALTKWADDLDIPYHTLRRRYSEGWTIKEIVKEYR
jgi:hypothetical protein